VAPVTVRVLPYAVADGPHNMASDEVLLRSAVDGRASLRFYGWSSATVSLGYFQPVALCIEHPFLQSLPCVRRPSGGATLVHHHELTYCLGIPAILAGPRGTTWLSRMHGIIVAALRGFGVHTCLHEGAEVVKGPVLCFLDHTPGDVVLDDAKIVGSAQRRRHGALLQHGAILLARSPFTPELQGLRELADIALTPTECLTSIRAATASGTGWQLADDVWTADERREVERLTMEKYATSAWTNKR
jgi:lipoate-protein ligase A